MKKFPVYLNCMQKSDSDKKRIRDGLYFASIVIGLMLLSTISQLTFDMELYKLGIFPRKAHGIIGIFTTVFVHGDFMHFFNNAVPLFFSILGIFYFYPNTALRIIILNHLITHFLIWIFARESYHIGASGLVYSLLSFLFFGGAFSNNKNLLALSLILVFLYGTLFWGILPVESNVSWESHLIGAVCGFCLSWIFRKKTLPGIRYDWEDEEDEDDESDESNFYPYEYWKKSNFS
jgi:membrane associated rhomboid family serine protease